MIKIIGLSILAFPLVFLFSQRKQFFYQSIFLFIFSVLLLGERGIWEYPISLPGYIPPVVIMFFYFIFFIFICKNIQTNIEIHKHPLFSIIIIFIITYYIATLRGFYFTDDIPRYIRSSVVYSMTGFIFFIILSLERSLLITKKYTIH